MPEHQLPEHRLIVETIQGADDRVATMLPGRGYTTEHPLFWFTSSLLVARGWTVRRVAWPPIVDLKRPETVVDAAREALDGVQAGHHLVVAKSLGTMAMPLAVERNLPGVWLTPILTHPAVIDHAQQLSASSLLMGGTADRLWDGAEAAALAADRPAVEVVEIPDANHSLEINNDPVASLQILERVIRTIDSFVERLDTR